MLATGSRLAAVLVCHVAVVIGLPGSAAAQERQLFMSVMSAGGDPVLDLQADEVQIRQTGAECRIIDLQPETNGMKVALIVDTSGAAAGSLVALREGLTGFLDALPATHEIGLFTIAGQLRQHEAFTTDREVLQETAGGLFVDRSSRAALVDGLLETWDRRFEEEDAWPVFVIVVHDGPASTFRERDFNEFVADLIRRGATVHAVVVSDQGRLNATVALHLTKNTGGIYEAVAAPTALATILPDLAADMTTHYQEARQRYRVVYACDRGDSTGSITAGVTRPGLNLRLFADRHRTP